MTVKLLYASPLWLAAHAIRMSHDSHDNADSLALNQIGATCTDCGSTLKRRGRYFVCEKCDTAFDEGDHIGKKDKELIYRVGNKYKHKSVLEQLVYWFDIDGISRACLQELARHRTARLTVKSTRYTLKELKKEESFVHAGGYMSPDWKRANDYLVFTGDPDVDELLIYELEYVWLALQEGKSNDIAKYLLPEAFATKLQWQIDGRNLQNFLQLRTSTDALWEIRELARKIYFALPDEHMYLYKDYVNEN